jgi:hypothetical protein
MERVDKHSVEDDLVSLSLSERSFEQFWYCYSNF